MTLLKNPVPVVDLFAGPGGLGEGFNAARDEQGDICFKTVLSIEKDIHAHMTLELRAFFRAFGVNVPEDYYLFLKGEISREELFRRHEEEAKAVAKQAWLAELGSAEFPPEYVDRRIREALAGQDIWALIGGPPCQAYSTVGRSRMRGADPAAYEADHRHFLYREFLRILAVHRPPVFVMENVKGLLSARVNGQSTFEKIIEDLKNPMGHQGSYAPGKSINYENLHYNLFSVSKGQGNLLVPTEVSQYVVESEKHGVPQRRHRVIVIGIRDDFEIIPDKLPLLDTMFSTQDAIGDLPRLRSSLSKEDDSITSWLNAVRSIAEYHWLNTPDFNHEVRNKIISTCERLIDSLTKGGRFIPYQVKPRILHDWYHDDRLHGVCNHTTKSHMRKDLHRYM
ncbi:MAG: DNA cytosine methyltransferase, partial [Deltaproteobacteria bacterium]|nr:DNA cytosine methyltransferase [Deltaproteobacteria bacterium]